MLKSEYIFMGHFVFFINDIEICHKIKVLGHFFFFFFLFKFIQSISFLQKLRRFSRTNKNPSPSSRQKKSNPSPQILSRCRINQTVVVATQPTIERRNEVLPNFDSYRDDFFFFFWVFTICETRKKRWQTARSWTAESRMEEVGEEV